MTERKDRIIDDTSDEILEGTWEAPRFYVVRGAELGYHCHLYETIGEKDTGVMITMVEMDVYAERHRVGKVRKKFNISSIGDGSAQDIIVGAGMSLISVPQDCRRRPSQNAILLGRYNQDNPFRLIKLK